MDNINDTHDCAWRKEAYELRELVKAQGVRILQFERMIYGKRSEVMRSVKKEVAGAADPQITQETRTERRADRQQLPEVTYQHAVKPADKTCSKCGSCELKKLGLGKISSLIELVKAKLERQVHIQETLVCTCGEYVVTADGPIRPTEGGHYGPALIAHVVASKCVDSIPLYRMEKQFKRAGATLPRSTLCNVFHQAADAVKPIYQRMLALVPTYRLVMADETPIPVMAENKVHKGFMWSFITDDFILYRYSHSRSGITPSAVLKESQGVLLTDGFSGYNKVCTPEGRTRAGCWAHARRKFFEAKTTAPEADFALKKIKNLYQIEYDAETLGFFGKEEHLELRKQRAGPILSELQAFLADQANIHPPKSSMGQAIGYAVNNWAELNHFMHNAEVPLDNNASERALRIIAIGRKNYLFAGNDAAAENLAGLYSLMASCELNDINPEQYLADMLIRVHTHPQQNLDDLLPHRWKLLFK